MVATLAKLGDEVRKPSTGRVEGRLSDYRAA